MIRPVLFGATSVIISIGLGGLLSGVLWAEQSVSIVQAGAKHIIDHKGMQTTAQPPNSALMGLSTSPGVKKDRKIGESSISRFNLSRNSILSQSESIHPALPPLLSMNHQPWR